MQKIAIIIPCYNEEKRLKLKEIQFLIENSNLDVYFANDGSEDDTLEVLEKINHKHNQRISILDYGKNEGKGNTIYKSVKLISTKSEYDYIGYLDADFSTPASEIIRMSNELKLNHYQLIFGSRILLLNSKIDRKWQRHIIGRIITTLINLKFNLNIYDTQCGAKIFSKEIITVAFSKPFLTSWLFDVELFIRLKKNNLLENACEFPLKKWKDIDGSKLNWKTSIKILKELLLLNKYY